MYPWFLAACEEETDDLAGIHGLVVPVVFDETRQEWRFATVANGNAHSREHATGSANVPKIFARCVYTSVTQKCLSILIQGIGAD